MATKTIYTCDICEKDSPQTYIIPHRHIPVVFITEQTEGRSTSPYLSIVNMDICQDCDARIIKERKIPVASGAQGHNTYYFE